LWLALFCLKEFQFI